MERRDVQQFYNDYKNSMSVISRIENRLLKESYSYEKWYGTLQLQSKLLREIYAKNVREYDRVINTVVKDPDALSPEVKLELLTHVDFFLSEGYRDYGVTVPVLNAILPYWLEQKHPGKIMDCYYFLGVSLSDSHYYGEACNAFTKSLETYEDFMTCPEPYWTYRMLCASYYRLLSYIEIDRYTEDVLYLYYREAYDMWTDPRIPEWMISAKKKDAIPRILRSLMCYALSRMLDQNVLPSEELLGILIEQYDAEKGDASACAAETVYFKYLRATGRMTAEAYTTALLNRVETMQSQFDLGFTYGLWDFTALFDDETTDETFDEHKLFYMNPSFAYVNYVLSELLLVADSEMVCNRVSHLLYRYFLELPAITADGSIDTLLNPILTILVARCDEEDLLVSCILNLLVHRQINTAIHVTMVAILSRSFAHHMILKHPEYFYGVMECETKEQVLASAKRIEDFAYKAGLCHDLGKLTCTEVIRLQNRKILREEFERIKNHPVAGASMLMNSDTLFDYAFIALCHHIYDDESRGYPEGVLLPQDASRIFVEIITVCDSIEAMSDNLGRNYANPKDMKTVIKELTEQSTTRYSARVVNFLVHTPELLEELTRELYEERINVHYDIYRQYVVPDTKFLPEDERFVSPVQEEDLDKVCRALDLDTSEMRELFGVCRNYSYVIMDGHGDIFGVTMCEPVEGNLWMRRMEVRKKDRRKGIGTMLISHLENEAYQDKMEMIYVPDVPKGHYDKFAWQMGYFKCGIEKWLAKKL